MALESNMLPLGTALPDAILPDLDGADLNVASYADGRPLLVMFVCNHCPYVRHVEHALADVLTPFDQDLAVVAICSNDTEEYPDDDVDGLREQQSRAGWTFPYLVDANQSVALAFHAACTPDFFLFNRAQTLAYRGAFDGSTPKNGATLDGALLTDAITHVLNNEAVPEPHRPSMGCGIKWKPGNDPNA